MSVTSGDDFEVQIKDFLSAQLSIPRNRLRLQDSFSHDYGVDGDDAVELIQAYSALFDVSVDSFELDKYFGPEQAASPLRLFVWAYYWMFDKSKLPTMPRFTVKDLLDGIEAGKLGH